LGVILKPGFESKIAPEIVILRMHAQMLVCESQ